MTSKEWTELIAKEFSCSKLLAKEMYHGMATYYNIEHRIKAIGNKPNIKRGAE